MGGRRLMKQRNLNLLISAGLFLLSLLIYLKFLGPYVYWKDSGELSSTSYSLGISHSAGAPLYNTLGKLFTLIPLGNVATRSNLMSAFFAALAVVIVYLIMLKIILSFKPSIPITKSNFRLTLQSFDTPINYLLPLIVALMFATSYTFCYYALIADIFTTYTMFILGMVYLMLKWKEERNLQYLFLFFLIFGLSMTFHPTVLLIMPAFLGFILISNFSSLKNVRNIVVMICLFFLGVSLFLVLPLRSAYSPFLNYGRPSSFPSFLQLIAQKEIYKSILFEFSLKGVLTQIVVAFYFFDLQFAWHLGCLALLGLGYFVRRRRDVFIFLLSILLLNFLSFVFLPSIPSLDLWHMDYVLLPSYIIIFLAFGFTALLLIRSLKRGKMLAFILALSLFFLVLGGQLGRNYILMDGSKDYSAFRQGKEVFKNAQRDALILTDDIGLNSLLRYFHVVEGKRRDVAVICTSFLGFSWYLGNLKENYPRLNIPDYLFKLCDDTLKYDDKNNALIGRSILMSNKTNPTYLIFSEKHEQEILYSYFSSFPQSFVLRIVEFEKERIKTPFTLTMQKLDKE